jgi:hypothetical protein
MRDGLEEETRRGNGSDQLSAFSNKKSIESVGSFESSDMD